MDKDTIVGIGFLIFLGGPLMIVYAMPTIVAYKNGARHFWTIVFLNIFLGWSVIAWTMAMAMAIQNYDTN